MFFADGPLTGIPQRTDTMQSHDLMIHSWRGSWDEMASDMACLFSLSIVRL